MIFSFRALWGSSSNKITRVLSAEHFITFLLLYTTIFVGFALLYMILEFMGYRVLDELHSFQEDGFYTSFKTNLYFSAMTLFSVGYGDVVPLGIGKMVVTIEALIGYTMPAAFVVHSFREHEKRG